jgi:hypothetical protein
VLFRSELDSVPVIETFHFLAGNSALATETDAYGHNYNFFMEQELNSAASPLEHLAACPLNRDKREQALDYQYCDECEEAISAQIETIRGTSLVTDLKTMWDKVHELIEAEKRDDVKASLVVLRRILATNVNSSKEMLDKFCDNGLYYEWAVQPWGDWLGDYGFEPDEDELADMESLLNDLASHPQFDATTHSLKELGRQRHLGQAIWMGMCGKVSLEECERCMPILMRIAKKHSLPL